MKSCGLISSTRRFSLHLLIWKRKRLRRVYIVLWKQNNAEIQKWKMVLLNLAKYNNWFTVTW